MIDLLLLIVLFLGLGYLAFRVCYYILTFLLWLFK